MLDHPPTPGDLIAVAALIVGFAVTVIMFRVQRELSVQEQHPEWPNWLAYSDYLILASVGLAIISLIVLLAIPEITQYRRAIAAASCVAAIILQAGYIPGILAHYRIAIGKHRTTDREEAEPAERVIVRVSVSLAAIVFIFVLRQHLRQ
jgi:hypothetical protein